MNENALQDRGDAIKVDVKAAFGQMTDADLDLLAADLNTGPGILQQRYGFTLEEAQRRWNEFIERCSDSSWNTSKAFGFVVNSGSGSDQSADVTGNERGDGKASRGKAFGFVANSGSGSDKANGDDDAGKRK